MSDLTKSESLSAYVRRTGTTESDQAWIADRIAELEAWRDARGGVHEHVDMEIYGHVAALPDSMLRELALGPLPEDGDCKVCRTLGFPQFSSGPVDKHVMAVCDFHGNDPMRCGVIYGMAKAIRSERWKASIKKMRHDNPEAYRDA